MQGPARSARTFAGDASHREASNAAPGGPGRMPRGGLGAPTVARRASRADRRPPTLATLASVADDDAPDEAPDDASIPETLPGGLGGMPPSSVPPDESSVLRDASRGLRFDAGPPVESRMSRFVSWLRWAAAPLVFFLFLAGLTAFGLLKDDSTTDIADEPMADVAAVPTSAPTTTETTATTAAPTTVAEPPASTAPPPLEPEPSAAPQPTEPPATAPPATSPPEPRAAGAAAPAPATPRYGPVCGYRPGQVVRITINGRPAGSVTADANGCVSVRR